MAFRSDRHIMARRAQEEKLADFNYKLKAEFNMKHKADWENKTDTVLEKNMMKTRMAELKKQHDELLEIRRMKLVELLTIEEKQYEQEFFANLETPEQVREKMAKRLHELRTKREQERKAEVERRMEAKFKQSTDELRKLDSQFTAANVKLDQEQQMLEKVKCREDEMMEEQLYAELWKSDLAQKEKREIEEKEIKKKMIDERMKFLDWQKNTRDTQKFDEIRKDKAEKEMLRTQWKEEDLRAKALEEAKLRQQKELNLELLKHNDMEKELRDRILAQERLMDKEMIQKIMDENRRVAELEQDLKLKRKVEAKEMLNTLNNRAELAKQEELAMEKLAEEERLRQVAREDAKFMKEQEARINLMKDVYSDRANAIVYKKEGKMTEKTLLDEEKRYIQAKILREQAEEEEKAALARLKKKQHQGDIVEQVKAKDYSKRKEEQEKMYEKRAMMLAEMEYQKRIDIEKEKTKKEIQTLKSTKGMANYAMSKP